MPSFSWCSFWPWLLWSALCSIGALACDETEQPAQGAGAVQVTVVSLVPEKVTLTRVLPGRTSPFLVAEVRPRVGGIIEQRLFTEGGIVEDGQALYQLDDATYRADVSSARASLARAKVTHESAKMTAWRFNELAKNNLVTGQQNQDATASWRQAAAELKAAEAALARALITLDYSRIESPITGRIGKSSVTQGALVTANQPEALATVQQLDPIYVDVTRSASEFLELRKEAATGKLEPTGEFPVEILLEDDSRYAHEGVLTFADVTVDPSTGSFDLRVQVPNPDNLLLPGMYVRAVVATGVRPDAVLVPQQGISRDQKGNATAMVVGKDDKVVLRSVETNRTVGNKWLVDSGLAAGDRVIVEGLQKVRAGMPVRATQLTKSGPATDTGMP